MTKTTVPGSSAPRFEYALMMIPPAGVALASGQASTPILGGYFDAAGTAQQGIGHLVVSPAEAIDAGATLAGLEKLVTLTIDYDTEDWPQQLTMTVVNRPPAAGAATTQPASATYTYERDQNGDGAMTFTLLEDIVPGPAGVDTLLVTSRWQGAGGGRLDLSVTAGDRAGQASETECWDATSQSTYESKSWMPLDVTGDPSTCISLL
jgi:hypothetical protein